MQQISAALVIILKHKTRPTKRAPTTTAKAVLVITARIIIIKRILIASKHKENSKNRYYRLHQQ